MKCNGELQLRLVDVSEQYHQLWCHKDAAAARVSEVEQELKTTVTEKEEKFAQLKRESDAAQAEFIEVIEQAEAEFDDNTDRLKLELQSTKEAAKEMEEDLNAQTHVYSR